MEYQEIYNKAAHAAINCKKDRVRMNQINQLLSIFNSNAMKPIDNTLMLLMSFVMKQTFRNLFRKDSSGSILSTLKEIKKDEKENRILEAKEKKKDTREYLGILKWLFQVSDKLKVEFNKKESESFDSIVETFRNWTKAKRDDRSRNRSRRY